MPQVERRARLTWEGNLIQGHGSIVQTSSGALANLPVTWASRTEQPDGKTSPEELIAAAHAECYAMGLAHGLATGGTPAEKLDVEAVCTLSLAQADPKFGLWISLCAAAFRDLTKQRLKKPLRSPSRHVRFLTRCATTLRFAYTRN